MQLMKYKRIKGDKFGGRKAHITKLISGVICCGWRGFGGTNYKKKKHIRHGLRCQVLSLFGRLYVSC